MPDSGDAGDRRVLPELSPSEDTGQRARLTQDMGRPAPVHLPVIRSWRDVYKFTYSLKYIRNSKTNTRGTFVIIHRNAQSHLMHTSQLTPSKAMLYLPLPALTL